MKNENDKTEDDADMKDVWEEQMYACEFCDDVFQTVDDMLQHRSTHDEANEDNPN